MMACTLTKFGNATMLRFAYRFSAYDVFDNDGNFIACISSNYIIDFLGWYEQLNDCYLNFYRNCRQHGFVIG